MPLLAFGALALVLYAFLFTDADTPEWCSAAGGDWLVKVCIDQSVIIEREDAR